jgi:adenylylsulfate kinase
MFKKIVRNKNKGILFLITGLSGSGKTSIAKRIKKKISNLYGPTIEISGNNLRKILKWNKYTQKSRHEHIMNYFFFAKIITDQKINLIFNVVGMYEKFRSQIKKIDNYIEIYIKADIHKIINLKKKTIYFRNKKNVFGLDIKPVFPKKSHIVINNDFNKNIDELVKELLVKIRKLNL